MGFSTVKQLYSFKKLIQNEPKSNMQVWFLAKHNFQSTQGVTSRTETRKGGGGLPYGTDGDARRTFWITRKGDHLGVAQAFCDP